MNEPQNLKDHQISKVSLDKKEPKFKKNTKIPKKPKL